MERLSTIAGLGLTKMPAMRLRLVHQIFLLLLGTVVLAVLAMGALVVWNLRAGFSEYLRAQDALLLDRVLVVAENDVRQRRGVPGGEWRPRLRAWVEATSPRVQRRIDDETGFEDLLRGPPPPVSLLPPPRPPHPPRDPANLGQRLLLFSPDGRELWAGRRELAHLPGQHRAVKLDGQDLALLRLVEPAGPVDQVDASFLRRQYLGIAGIAVALVLLALVAARVLARRWVRPLQQAQAAAGRMAAGEFQVRVGAEGEDELAELGRDLNAMAASLQNLEASRRRWIAELSHELRTPLAVLRGELEALADGIRPLDRAALASLQDEVARLTRLTEDFHTLACSDLRELPCELAPLRPTDLLATALARVAERAKARGLSLEAAWPADLGTAVWDAQRIAQLLGNLLENSLRYTDGPGRVRLSAEAQPGWLRIAVDDSPPGVPTAALAQLFDPLYRVEGSRSRELGGSGLGLAIAQALVRSHHGRIHASASALGGLSVTVWLPVDASRAGGRA